jgi:rhamnulokinase
MHSTPKYLAFDLGAESGRAVVGWLEGGRMQFDVVHRFPNRPVRTADGLHWDILSLWAEVQEGISRAVQQHGNGPAGNLVSIGVDTWGSDCALLDAQGTLIANPWHYRDVRTDGMQTVAESLVPRAEIYAITGNQFMRQNTMLQLLAMAQAKSPLLGVTDCLLMIPDLFNFWLCGRRAVEFSGASTTQFYDPRRGAWATDLLARLGIPSHFLPEIVPPGVQLGTLAPWLQARCSCGPLAIVTTVSHDTGSAVAAVPSTGAHFAYISSGTWSLVGAEVERPVITDAGLALNVTNEGGIEGTFRYLKNVLGLWLVQEARRTWQARGQEYTYAELTALAEQAPSLRSLIDPDNPVFFDPGDSPARVQAYCARTGQPVPQSVGEIVRCMLDSLALKYRWVIENIEQILGHRLEPLYILGGGAQNNLLNQNTANALNRRVVAGPVEATAVGNLAVQMMAAGQIPNREAARAIIAQSVETTIYEPTDSARWDEAYARLTALMAGDQSFARSE